MDVLDRRTRRRSISHQVNLGSDYERDEIEFMRAMDRYKRERRRPFPTCSEVLAVLKSLGYAKIVSAIMVIAGWAALWW